MDLKQIRQMQYQQELKRQADEQKAVKDEQRRRIKVRRGELSTLRLFIRSAAKSLAVPAARLMLQTLLRTGGGTRSGSEAQGGARQAADAVRG